MQYIFIYYIYISVYTGKERETHSLWLWFGRSGFLQKNCLWEIWVLTLILHLSSININSVVKSSFFQLRLLSKAKSFLSFKELERVIHAFASSRLDYCNSLYMGISQSNINRLQMVQNAAARLLTGTRRFDHISPVLCSLHWLPVCYRIEFKILLLVFKALSGMAPEYLSDLLNPNTSSRPLRSSEKRVLMVPRSR